MQVHQCCMTVWQSSSQSLTGLERCQHIVALSEKRGNFLLSISRTPCDFSRKHFIHTVCACCSDDTEQHKWDKLKLRLIKSNALMLYFKSCFPQILFSPARIRIKKQQKKKQIVAQKCAWNAIPQSKHLVYLDDKYHGQSVFSTSIKKSTL